MTLPLFDDVLAAVGAEQFNRPDPRQDHVVNTLVQVAPIRQIQEVVGRLAGMGREAYPGYIKLLGEHVQAQKLVLAACQRFLVETAKALDVEAPPELVVFEKSAPAEAKVEPRPSAKK